MHLPLYHRVVVTWRVMSTMAAQTSFQLGSTAFGSVAVKAVCQNWTVSGPSLVNARFKRLGAAESLSWSAAHGVNQTEEGFSRRLVTSSSRKVGVALVRSQGVAGVEAPAVENIEAGDPVHKVVIVGAGIAGLSAAVALHRVGIKLKVLEQSSSVRASGTSLTLWTNGWRALDYLGVADGLRENHDLNSGPHEVRGVERKLLVEALAAELPPGTIQLSSRVHAIHRQPGEGLTKVELKDGRVISTKVLVGCDGVNSVVAKWLGLSPTRYVGQIGLRGVAEYPNGHNFGDEIVQYVGKGQRFGISAFSDSKVYWFCAFNSSSPGPKVTDGNLVKVEALQRVSDGWPDKAKEVVMNTPIESIARSAISDRWNISGVTPALLQEGVTLAGDAMHPMTPNLAQGGGTAIEDGIVLARTLGDALSQGGDAKSIQKALEEYVAQRHERTFSITVKSFLMGVLFMIEFPLIVYIRDNFVVPKLIRPSSYLAPTLFDVGKLPTCKVSAE